METNKGNAHVSRRDDVYILSHWLIERWRLKVEDQMSEVSKSVKNLDDRVEPASVANVLQSRWFVQGLPFGNVRFIDRLFHRFTRQLQSTKGTTLLLCLPTHLSLSLTVPDHHLLWLVVRFPERFRSRRRLWSRDWLLRPVGRRWRERHSLLSGDYFGARERNSTGIEEDEDEHENRRITN